MRARYILVFAFASICVWSGCTINVPTPSLSSSSPGTEFTISGVAAIDYDLDGRYDLYFASGRMFPLKKTTGPSINRFYRNNGDWRFQDVTEPCRLTECGFSAGVTVGDYDADGFPDLYVACGISGASHHVAGMRDSQHIVAINHDAAAPIHDLAHLSIVGDLHRVVPSIRAALARRKGG